MIYKVVIPDKIDTTKISTENLKLLLEFEGVNINAEEKDGYITFMRKKLPSCFFVQVEEDYEYCKENFNDDMFDLFENLSIALYKLMLEQNIDKVETYNKTFYLQDLENIFENRRVSSYLGDD